MVEILNQETPKELADFQVLQKVVPELGLAQFRAQELVRGPVPELGLAQALVRVPELVQARGLLVQAPVPPRAPGPG